MKWIVQVQPYVEATGFSQRHFFNFYVARFNLNNLLLKSNGTVEMPCQNGTPG